MKELDEMAKINGELAVALEEVNREHCKKNEVI